MTTLKSNSRDIVDSHSRKRRNGDIYQATKPIHLQSIWIDHVNQKSLIMALKSSSIIPDEVVISKIYFIRGKKAC